MYEKERFDGFFDIKHEVDYQPDTMYQMLAKTASRYPDVEAYEFMGKKTNYTEVMRKIENTAKALTAIGIREGDAVTICMPNCPQAIDMFYAISRIGAIANMVHPLSAQEEITYYLNISESKVILTLDQFYDKVVAARSLADHQVIIIMATVAEELPLYLKVPFQIKQGNKYANYPNKAYSLTWKEFIHMGKKYPLPLPNIEFKIDRVAAILYSGGTTGTNKGIMLSDLNFNALSRQTIKVIGDDAKIGDKILAVMPVFHGFGLGIGIHTCITNGIGLILIPQFSIKTYAQNLIKKKPNYIAGVPTLFEALLRTKGLDGEDLSFLKGMFSGGDSLSIELKAKVDQFLKEHGAKIQVREGYGTTECVTASCLTPKDTYKPGSIGLGFPDTDYVICNPGTTEELPIGQEGEICLTGPTVMLGYLKNDQETADTLKVHADGRIYLHTGDLGYMDDEKFVYFKQRIKRMIITSGYNVYPSQVENVIDGHPKVHYSCVIGVKDAYRMERVKAFIVLKNGIVPDESIKQEILNYCSQRIAKYAMPREIEFRDDLPKTLVGKVAYRVLEAEEAEKIKNAENKPVEKEKKTAAAKTEKKPAKKKTKSE
ncbi:MAG: AMP-binding protein [Erysipelotrichaceae bacterium]|nr:AMP-binding protein [Erysipelotrichaceae bacterium]MBO4538157.1 AMP-binding protein [Erysipelotrichaceae bacterium]